MGAEFDIVAWYRMAIFFSCGFLPVWAITYFFFRNYRRNHLINTLGKHYPKALPISNLFFIVTQLAAAWMRPAYLENISGKMAVNPFFLLLCITSLLMLAFLFFPQGHRFNRFILLTGVLQVVLFVTERFSAGVGQWEGRILTWGYLWLQSAGWFLLLGLLIMLSELARARLKK